MGVDLLAFSQTSQFRPQLKRFALEWLLPFFVIVVAGGLLYGRYLDLPVIFDDWGMFGTESYRKFSFSFGDIFSVRTIPYASMLWQVNVFGDSVVPLRVVNLIIHIMNGLLVFALTRQVVMTVLNRTSDSEGRVSLDVYRRFLLLMPALIFVLHPVATFAVAYLIQRTILLVVFFALISWLFFFEGLKRKSTALTCVAALFYFFSGLCKQQAIFVFLATFVFLPVVLRVDRAAFRFVVPSFVLHVAVAALLLYLYQFTSLLGQAYEPFTPELMGDLSDVQGNLHALSIANQAWLFFKYIGLWLLPIPAWMSISFDVPFPRSYLTQPQLFGVLLFLIWVGVAFWCLLKQGAKSGFFLLAGLSMLVPVSQFLVEFSVVRVQEIFVLYRSYLWFSVSFVVVPWLLWRRSSLMTAPVLLAVLFGLFWASNQRLSKMERLEDLWRESIVQSSSQERPNWFHLSRAYHNRAHSLLPQGRYEEALSDMNASIALDRATPGKYNDRAVAYLELGRYEEALADYNRALSFGMMPISHYGRGKVLIALGRDVEGHRDYVMACQLGVSDACREISSGK